MKLITIASVTVIAATSVACNQNKGASTQDRGPGAGCTQNCYSRDTDRFLVRDGNRTWFGSLTQGTNLAAPAAAAATSFVMQPAVLNLTLGQVQYYCKTNQGEQNAVHWGNILDVTDVAINVEQKIYEHIGKSCRDSLTNFAGVASAFNAANVALSENTCWDEPFMLQDPGGLTINGMIAAGVTFGELPSNSTTQATSINVDDLNRNGQFYSSTGGAQSNNSYNNAVQSALQASATGSGTSSSGSGGGAMGEGAGEALGAGKGVASGTQGIGSEITTAVDGNNIQNDPFRSAGCTRRDWESTCETVRTGHEVGGGYRYTAISDWKTKCKGLYQRHFGMDISNMWCNNTNGDGLYAPEADRSGHSAQVTNKVGGRQVFDVAAQANARAAGSGRAIANSSSFSASGSTAGSNVGGTTGTTTTGGQNSLLETTDSGGLETESRRHTGVDTTTTTESGGSWSEVNLQFGIAAQWSAPRKYVGNRGTGAANTVRYQELMGVLRNALCSEWAIGGRPNAGQGQNMNIPSQPAR
jgi:hypothetical protein